MSYTASSAISTCQVAGLASAEEAALAVLDYLVNHPNEIPLVIENELVYSDETVDTDEFVDYIKEYLDLHGERLTIHYSSETTGRDCDAEVFNLLSNHFACLQKSLWMTVTWVVEDSRTGHSAGTDFYDRSGERIDVDAALTQYLLS